MLVYLLCMVVAAIIVMVIVFGRWDIKRFVRFRCFRQHANHSGLSKQQQALLWHLIEVYRVKDIRRVLMNSRLLNATLSRAIREVELDLSMSLKEREIKQYQYYEIKRHFDRMEVLPTIRSTKELSVGSQIKFNRPHDVRLLLTGSCQRIDSRGFVVEIDKKLMESWLKLDKGELFEFTYRDEHRLEYHFDAQLRTFEQEGGSLLLLFKHSAKMQLIMNRKPPAKRVEKEVLLAKSSFDTAAAMKDTALTLEKGQQGVLLELSLAGAVIKSVPNLGVNQFVYIQFLLGIQPVVCYGRIEQVVHVGNHYQLHVQFLQTSRSSLNQISSLVYDL